MLVPDPPPTDDALLEACRMGDERAFKLLVERHHDRLLSTAIGMLGDEKEAESVVLDGFLRFYRTVDKFEGRSSLRTYLTRIVMNQALKALRKRQRWYRRFLGEEAQLLEREESVELGAFERLELDERSKRVRDAVQSLPPEFRSVVVLRFLNDNTTDECAKILGIPSGTVMSRLSRALDKLAPQLKDLKPFTRTP